MASKDNGVESETVIHVPVPPAMPVTPTDREAASTSRVLWISAYLVLMVLVALRLPLVKQSLTAHVPPDVRAELGDDRLLSLSMTVGTVLFFLVYAVIIGLYFSLAGFLDRRLIPSKVIVAGHLKVGVFFVIAVFATIPVNLLSVSLGILQPRELAGYWLCFPVMAVVVLALFHRHWRGRTVSNKILILLSALGLSTVIALG
jgi:hypothetical protein